MSTYKGKTVNDALIKECLNDTDHHDPDNRFMALRDLFHLVSEYNILTNYPQFEDKLKQCFLRGLDDHNMSVKGQANSCLIAAVKGFSGEGVTDVIRKLVSNMVNNEKPDMYSIYSLGLADCMNAMKTDVTTEESKGVKAAYEIVLPGIVNGVKMPVRGYDDAERNRKTLARLRELLNVMSSALDIYGPWCGSQWNNCFSCLKDLIVHEMLEIREHARGVFGVLVNCVDDNMFKTIVEFAIEFLQKHADGNSAVQLVATICRFGETKIGTYLDQIVPDIIARMKNKNEDTCDMVVACLQACGTMFLRCPEKLEAYAQDMVSVNLELLTWDPNMEEEEEEVVAATEEDDGEDSWGDDDDWGDDDAGDEDDPDNQFNDANFVTEVGADSNDNSWKVRRAAARCLSKTFETRPAERRRNFDDYIKVLCKELSDERDSRVKIAVAKCFCSLVKTCIQDEPTMSMMQMKSSVDVLKAPTLRRQRSMTDQLMIHWEGISSIAIGQLQKGGESEYILEIISLCEALLDVSASTSLTDSGYLMSGFEDNFQVLFPALDSLCGLEEVQKEVFQFMMKVVARHDCTVVQTKASEIAAMISKAFKARATNMMKTLLMTVMRVTFKSFYSCRSSWENPKEIEGVLGNLLESLFITLEDMGLSLACKAAAVRSAGACMAYFGDIFADEYKQFLTICLARLKEQIVPIAVLKSIQQISNAAGAGIWSGASGALVAEIAPYLRKQDRNIRQAAAAALTSIIKSEGSSMPTDNFFVIILNVVETELLKPQDPKMCESLFILFDSMFQIPNLPSKVTKEMLQAVTNQVTQLLMSPVLGADVLVTCKKFLGTFAKTIKSKECDSMRAKFLSVLEGTESVEVIGNVAQCIATVTCAQDMKTVMSVIKKFEKQINAKDGQIALGCIGEIGSLVSLKDYKDIDKKIISVIKTSKSPPRRLAAANALGLIVSGDLVTYVPTLLSALSSEAEYRYLLSCSLLTTLRTCQSDAAKLEALQPSIPSIKPFLMGQASTQDEGERMVIGDCLGRLASLDQELFEEISKQLNEAKSAEERAVMAIAVKSVISFSDTLETTGAVEDIFAGLDREKEQIARTELMNCLHLLLSQKPELVEGDMSHIEDLVYPHCKTNTALVKKVQIGSMTHVIDDGLPHRTAVFRVMDTLQSDFIWRLRLDKYFAALGLGFHDDNEDIQARVFGIVAGLAQKRLKFVVNHLNGMKGKMTTGAKALLKKSKQTGAEGERAKDHTKLITNYLWKTRKAIPAEMEPTCRDFCKFYIAITKTKQLVAYIKEFEEVSS